MTPMTEITLKLLAFAILIAGLTWGYAEARLRPDHYQELHRAIIIHYGYEVYTTKPMGYEKCMIIRHRISKTLAKTKDPLIVKCVPVGRIA